MADLPAEELQQNAIETADVSLAWKVKFTKIAKALPISFWGGYQNIATLATDDQKSIRFNTSALIFGPLYYFFLGMTAKGFVITAGYVIFVFMLIVFEYITNFRIYEVIFFANIMCAQFVDYDYFMYKTQHLAMWEKLSQFKSAWTAFFLFVATLLLCNTLLALGHIQTRNDLFREISGVWENAEGKRFVIALDELNQYIKWNDNSIEIEPIETDIKHGHLRFKSADSEKTIKSVNIRRRYASNGSVTLILSMNNEPEIELSKFLGNVSDQEILKKPQNISIEQRDVPAIKLPDINEIKLEKPSLNLDNGGNRSETPSSKNHRKGKSKKGIHPSKGGRSS